MVRMQMTVWMHVAYMGSWVHDLQFNQMFLYDLQWNWSLNWHILVYASCQPRIKHAFFRALYACFDEIYCLFVCLSAFYFHFKFRLLFLYSRYVMPSFLCYRRIMTRHIGVTKTYTISVNFLLSKWEKGIGIMGQWPVEVTLKFERNITISLVCGMTPNAWRTESKIARQCTYSGWSLIKTQD
jgi:hypothetical protein